jgi:hypothetical protein
VAGPIFPIYVFEKDDGSVFEFPTLKAMRQHLEAIDVANGEYKAWDAVGGCVELSVGVSKSEWLRIVSTDRRAPEADFVALRGKAEKRKEFEPTDTLLRRVRGWIGSRLKT